MISMPSTSSALPSCACTKTERSPWVTPRGETSPPCSVATSTTRSTTTTRRSFCPSRPLPVAALSCAFTVGFINSKDDFYVNNFGLGAMETTNAIYDDELYKECVPETVPSFIVGVIQECEG